MKYFQFLVLIVVFSNPAFCFQNRLMIDRSQNLDKLAHLGRPVVTAWQDGSRIYSDASGILIGKDFSELYRTSVDFNHYARMGMPHVQECHIVAQRGHRLDLWTYLNSFWGISQHYLEVLLYPPRGGRNWAGSEWQLIHPQEDKKYPEKSAFISLEGSWYMESMENNRIYVRYFLAVVVNQPFFAGIMDWFIQNQLAEGVAEVIRTLETHSR